MKESTSYNNKERLISILSQITDAIERLKDWNASVQTSDDYYSSSSGMQKLAASCMLIEAIGESVNQIDKMTEGRLFSLRPDIPWKDVIGIRNHIAHGYFDIDGDVVLSTIKEDIDPLLDAVLFLKKSLE